MVFSSAVFVLLFLPIFLLLYELTPQRWKNYTLLAASVMFYAWGAPRFIFVLLAFTLINYFVVNQMHKSKTQKKTFLIISIILNLLLLVVFKYANLFVDSLNDLLQLLGMEAVYWRQIALPIGISFFIFQSITYAVDIYRGECLPAKNYFHYLLYIISFPQLIAGPIVRYKTIASEILERHASFEDKLQGFYRFIIGLSKKVILANAMALQADALFGPEATLQTLPTLNAWLSVLAYTLQIYFDFSGYSDMAIGLGRIMGFHYPENFNLPYRSKNISEFWKRWHITLGDFMMNYLYIPLGGNRSKTKIRRYLNLWIVFLLSGLWHGASWTFLLWGAYHGLFIVLDKMGLRRLTAKLPSVVQILLTFIVVSFGWIIFNAGDFANLKQILACLFSFSNATPTALDRMFLPMIFFALFFAFAFKPNWTKTCSLKQHLWLFPVMLIILLLSLAHLLAAGVNPFIYFRF